MAKKTNDEILENITIEDFKRLNFKKLPANDFNMSISVFFEKDKILKNMRYLDNIKTGIMEYLVGLLLMNLNIPFHKLIKLQIPHIEEYYRGVSGHSSIVGHFNAMFDNNKEVKVYDVIIKNYDLPIELQDNYLYTLDGGHGINIVVGVNQDYIKSCTAKTLAMHTVPCPPKTVLKKGYEIIKSKDEVNFILMKNIIYDKVIGLIVDESDFEF